MTIAFLITGCSNATEESKDTKLISSTEYTCENGKTLSVTHFITEETIPYIRIEFEDAQYDLEKVHSASGEKYSDGKYTWWAKGSSGFFEVDDVITMRGCNLHIDLAKEARSQ